MSLKALVSKLFPASIRPKSWVSNGNGRDHVFWLSFLREERELERQRWDEEKRQLLLRWDEEKRQLLLRLDREKHQIFERWDQEKSELLSRLDELRNQKDSFLVEVSGLKTKVLITVDERLRLENNFNVRGGLERIVFQAAHLENLIPEKGPVQHKLDTLANLPAFSTILNDEVIKRRLVLADVKFCIGKIYHEVSTHAHGNTGMIELNQEYFTRNELAALICFFRLQSQWTYCLDWKEINVPNTR